MKLSKMKLVALICIIFALTLSSIKADYFSNTKFFFQWDSSFNGTPEEFSRIHNSFKIQNPNLSGLNDDVIAKKSEKDVEEVFKKVTAAKAQYEKAKNAKEKFVAQKILYNWTTLYKLYRTLVKPPINNTNQSKSTPKEDFRIYDNNIKPFRNFKVTKSEMTNEGFIIEFEYTYDEIEFYSSIKGKESEPLFYWRLFYRRCVLGSIHPEFLSNGKLEGYTGGKVRPDKSGARIKKTSVESDKYYLKNNNQITNTYINSYALEYAQKANINWPPNTTDKFIVSTYTDKWQWKPIVKVNFENKYLIRICNMFGKCFHEELITLKTGSDVKNAKAETKTFFDSEKIIWATFGILSALGLIGFFKTKVKPINQKTEKTEKTENTNTNENASEDTKDRPAIIFNTSGCSLVIKDGGQNVTKFTAKVVNSKLNGWKITAKPADNSAFLTIIQTSQSAANQAEFAVNTVGVVLNDNEFVKDCLINISAVLGTETIYAAHKAVVGREGLFVISQKPLKINADGSEISELALTATKFQNTYLETDQEALTNIKTIFEPENETAKKAFETAIVDFGADSEWRDIRKAIDSYQTNNVFASRVFKICTKNALPSGKNDDGSAKVFAGKLTIRSSCGYEQIISVEMSAPKEPTRSELLEQEYKNCRLIIERFVPAESGYQEKFYEMTDKYGRLFGPEGLYKLRHDIWAIAQKLWEAKGLQGYCEMAERLETYDKLRSWTEWTGDMALSVLLNLKTGGGLGGALSQTGIMLVKQMTVSAINHYKDTIELKGSFNVEDCESWLNNQLKMQLFATPDYMLTAASLKGFITPGRAAALMFANVFLRSLIMNIDWTKLGDKWDESGFDKESCNDICKAAWIASKECFKALSSMMLTGWLTGAAVRSAIKNNTKVHDDVLKQYAPEALKQAEIPVKKSEIYDPANTTDTVNTMVANIKNGKARTEDVVKCLADNQTQAMRTIKSLPQNVQKAFMETLRKEFYEPHDKALIKHLEAQTNVPWGTKVIDNKPTKVMIKIFEMSTPGKKTVFSQDRDFCPKYYDIKTEQWLEIVPAKHWKGVSDTWWKSKTGIKAELLQQAAMTRLGDEACPDYATQTLNQSTGLYEVGEPNIVKVYAGKAKLKSPIELAAMYKKKIDGPLEHQNVAESIAQLKKGVQVYDKLVKGYQKQGLLVKSPEPKFRLAMEIISWAPDDYRASTEVIKKINGLLSTETGYNDLNAFSHDLIMRLGNF